MVHRGVYAVGHRRLTPRGAWLAAVLAMGNGAVLSHRTAAALWSLLPTSASVVDVTVPGGGGRRHRDGIRVHRRRAPAADDVTTNDHIPVTTVARTLLDLAATARREVVARAFNEAERGRVLDLRAVHAVLSRHPGAPGTGRLSSVLEQWEPAETLTRSELERRFLELCRANGLETPSVNTVVQGIEVDFVWADARLIVETDGRSYHFTRRDFENDRARDAALTAAGYRVVRFSHRQITRAPRTVTAALYPALRRSPPARPRRGP
jgi:very-short-patch-repair endonuclease